MTEDLDLETYLYISPNKFGIYLFDKKNYRNLFEDELNFQNEYEDLNFLTLSKFLNDNIFKIEKLIGKFVKNIYLVIENEKILNIKFGIKKKNYHKIISKKYLENTLTEAKDLFKENYREKIILHMLVNNYFINDKKYSNFSEDLYGDELSLEIQFVYISDNFAILLEKTLEKFQIKITRYLDGQYIKKHFQDNNLPLSEMISKIKDGCNENEIRLVPKNKQKSGFFERFFQLFG
tara:strand:- start:950 stop:1654 length:705 start_codon:yes stop_codon:yes gene_type:complete